MKDSKDISIPFWPSYFDNNMMKQTFLSSIIDEKNHRWDLYLIRWKDGIGRSQRFDDKYENIQAQWGPNRGDRIFGRPKWIKSCIRATSILKEELTLLEEEIIPIQGTWKKLK